jgi:hypothetical protein
MHGKFCVNATQITCTQLRPVQHSKSDSFLAGEAKMTLSAPTQIVFWIAIVLAIIALIGWFGVLGAAIGGYSFWILLLGFVVLAVGCLLRGT